MPAPFCHKKPLNDTKVPLNDPVCIWLENNSNGFMEEQVECVSNQQVTS